MNTPENKISIANYYQGKVDEERLRDETFSKKNGLRIDESVMQRSSCWGGIFAYLQERGYRDMEEEIRKIYSAEGLSVSGFKKIIYFLETKFNETEARIMPAFIQAAQYEIALQEALSHIREISAYLEIHGGIDEEEGHQIISRANQFAAEHNQSATLDEIKCDQGCDLRKFYENNGNRCCKLWRDKN